MKILHISASDNYGGAAKSAYRIHSSLRRRGVQSSMLVRRKDTDDADVLAVTNDTPEEKAFAEKMAVEMQAAHDAWMRGRDYTTAFYTDHGKEGMAILRHARRLGADLIHLHWVADNFFDPTIFFGAADMDVPIVWRLPDIAALTGGCHFTPTCTRYQSQCGACPQLGNQDEKDISYLTQKRKAEALARYQALVHFVAPCTWMETTIHSSTVARRRPVSIIHNGVDTDFFKPVDGTAFRRQYGIPDTTLVIMMAAFLLPEARKGLDTLLSALDAMQPCDMTMVFIGHAPPDGPVPYPVVATGHLDDPAMMRAAYAAADIVVVPSLADNLPNVIFEAMACGRAVVATDVGGIADIVHDNETGLLLPPGDVAALTVALDRLAANPMLRQTLGDNARRYCTENLSLDCEADKYLALYRGLLATPRQA